jgi:hypothetical protein
MRQGKVRAGQKNVKRKAATGLSARRPGERACEEIVSISGEL